MVDEVDRCSNVTRVNEQKRLAQAAAKPCVQCGYCCTVRPCTFGEWDFERGRCKFLTDDMECGIYDDIKDDPRGKWNPAFGTGCCSPLFNTFRETKMRS